MDRFYFWAIDVFAPSFPNTIMKPVVAQYTQRVLACALGLDNCHISQSPILHSSTPRWIKIYICIR